MKVWVVGVSDCEVNSIVAICTTKEIAERELFKVRDKLIKEWQEMKEYWEKDGRPDDMYGQMIANLLGNDYEKWDNYPNEGPYLYETEMLDK